MQTQDHAADERLVDKAAVASAAKESVIVNIDAGSPSATPSEGASPANADSALAILEHGYEILMSGEALKEVKFCKSLSYAICACLVTIE